MVQRARIGRQRNLALAAVAGVWLAFVAGGPVSAPGGPPASAALLAALAALPPAAHAAAPPDSAAAAAPEDGGAALYYYLIAPPVEVAAVDHPNDNGGTIDITWELSPNDTETDRLVTGYVISRAGAVEGPYEVIGRTPARTTRFVDSAAQIGVPFFYKVDAEAGDVTSAAAPVGPVVSAYQWVNFSRWNLLVLLVALNGAVLWWVQAIQRGRQVTVRRIPALDAVQEAVGRATEMGRPILFLPGIQDMDDMQTVAGLTILGRVAATVAEYDATLEVPTARSLVMTAARETVQRAYYVAGRPDSYQPDSIYYVTNEQFGYVAAVQGTISREKPATCLYFGAFFAESLILSETGRGVGAVQIAGTAETTQIPFFLAACDYVLIGEEFYAASAYLSQDPRQLGSLRGQDLGKLVAGGALLAGCVLATVAALWPHRLVITLQGALAALFHAQ